MIVTIHQPEHLPWLGFCHKASQADVLVLLDVVQFRKNYFQNRNRILGPNGPQWLTVPVRLRGHTQKTIREMEIASEVAWAPGWWKSVYHAYGATPYFARYAPALEALSRRPWEHLAELNEAIIRWLFEALDLRCRLVRASTLPVTGARSALLLEICRQLGATTYLSGPSGRDYLDEPLFREAAVAVRYHAFEHPVYAQAGQLSFVSHLSAVDLLFREGPGSAAILAAASAVAA